MINNRMPTKSVDKALKKINSKNNTLIICRMAKAFKICHPYFCLLSRNSSQAGLRKCLLKHLPPTFFTILYYVATHLLAPMTPTVNRWFIRWFCKQLLAFLKKTSTSN